MPGGRGRIGVILPANNAGMEYDLWKMAPEGVTIHVTRMRPTKGCEPSDLDEFERELREAYHLLEEVSDVVIYGRTYGTHKHAHLIRKAIGNVVIPEEEVVKLLKKLGAKKVWVGTPYVKERTLEEVSWIRENGFEVTGYDGLGKVKGVDISNTPVFTIYRLVKRNLQEVLKADAVYIACTALSAYEAVKHLREDLKMPVVSENAAAMWGALNAIKVNFKVPGVEE
ncbi:MAG: arylmalonate decarboxylase [Candidatus Aramenus sulfurataquae]|jgi:maleate isomerase|uniref:Arylmalonate decarboxylase n=3 Tax=Candidatus Aramenus sulfurataquae TaxID=1326980 RepID=W7KX87_9CREN|nr:MAG: arylmalonate decarboxylase [Candidatus Aramenus sulfurataquae]MCL7344538.1 arylmalonate decarboxylase [Candidatus Aramenus sulfurataquae]